MEVIKEQIELSNFSDICDVLPVALADKYKKLSFVVCKRNANLHLKNIDSNYHRSIHLVMR